MDQTTAFFAAKKNSKITDEYTEAIIFCTQSFAIYWQPLIQWIDPPPSGHVQVLWHGFCMRFESSFPVFLIT
jgi:hypothetical protein